jgi:hypothetical protein
MISKKTLTTAALAAAAILASVRVGSAATISVHSLPNDTTSVSLVTTGPFTGDDAYTYDINFDSAADVVTPGNGFMVIDFGPVAGASLTGPAGAGATLASEFAQSTGTTGAGLSGFVNNTSNTDNFHDSQSGNSANPLDLTTIQNAVFNYTGATPYLANGATIDLTLVLYTTSTSVPLVGNGFGDDTSGVNKGLSFSLNSVYVPSAPAGVPLPTTTALGGTLLGLVALGHKLTKGRRVQA